MRESEIEKHLVKRLSALGVFVRKLRFIANNGAPDRLIYAMGGIYVELKAPGKNLRPNQRLEHRRMRAAGMRVEVIDSIEMVDALVNQIKWFLKK